MYAAMHETDAVTTARSLVQQRSQTQDGLARLPHLEEQVCSEAGIWAPEAAARAIAQSQGDIPIAVSLLKVWAAALPHTESLPVQSDDIRIVRRISSAYAEVPGGQWLGFAPELASRTLDWDDHEQQQNAEPTAAPEERYQADPEREADAPSRAMFPRARTLLGDVPLVEVPEDGDGADPAAGVVTAPHDRATRLGLLAGGETGALVSFAALILGRRREAVLAEMTRSENTVRVPHPRTGKACGVTTVPIVEAEAVLDADVEQRPGFAIGWGATMGTLERRAIAMALLDATMQADGELAERLELNEQTLLGAVDGAATNGFVEHLRLPHHASFASYLEQAKNSQPTQSATQQEPV
jgi:alpha-D-ribose 1-methylphosphonate 5-triphosphate synthase subunit PhnI